MALKPATVWIAAVATLVVGLGAGVGSAALAIRSGEQFGQTATDHWLGNRSVGSTRADPWTRAIIARIGLLALNRSETIYFTRYRDAEGDQLRADCDYEVVGRDLPARWWSVTIYADDDFLPMNEDRAFSVDATRVVRDSDGAWRARVSGTRGEATNWISSQAAHDYSLSLRLYNPSAMALAGDEAIPFPTVRRLGCTGDAA